VTGWRNRIHTLLPDEVAHWSPLSDPEGSGIGMSWLTPAIRDIQSDKAATEHKVRFFTNGATPNLVVKGLTATTKPQFDELVEMMEARHAGVANAYRTLYLTAGADATVVGSSFRDMDLKSIQGAGETRIAVLSRVPAPILNIAEGLSGSSLNAGNLGQSRRNFADSWIYPTLQDLSATLSSVVNVPSDAELWADTTDMPILREDAKDAAEIEDLKATTVTKYVREGFTAESSIAAVRSGDISLLKHTGYLSVQVQKPGVDPDKPEEETPLDLTRPGK
jgi:phage portal protein BeeE